VSVGSAAAWLRESLRYLVVDPARMRANVEAAIGPADAGSRGPGSVEVVIDRALAAHATRMARAGSVVAAGRHR
jgi:hypothetical protein